MVYYTYVLYSQIDKKFYIGYTGNLQRRLKEHQRGNNKSTRKRKQLKIIFFEGFISKKDALRREKYFKTTKGKKSLRLILRSSLPR